jgi:hypothetical protein
MSHMHPFFERWSRWGLAVISLAAALVASPLVALDYVTIRQSDHPKELAGKVEVQAVDGGVLFQTRDGVLWPVKTEEIVSRRSDEKPFVPLSRE